MTIYEQIQLSIDFIETNLFSKLSFIQVAKSAMMSCRSFYNYFWAITGFTYKEYVKQRRLTEALKILVSKEKNILDIALEIGYESHESFSRAFKKEFGITPINFKKCRQQLKGLDKIKLIKEMYMGVIVKELPEMKVACFEGFAPEPENKAASKMNEWLTSNGLSDKTHRIFGHNIDSDGNLSFDPDNIGYKFLVTIDMMDVTKVEDMKLEVINTGKFVVTGIEGKTGDHYDMNWIGDGWKKLNGMIREKGYKLKCPGRWFEEELKPSKPGNLRLDLYLEIE